MSNQTNATNQTQLSTKVDQQTLDRMYDNFVKMVDWVIKGKQSKYDMPVAYAAVFDTVELVQHQRSAIDNLSSTIAALQQSLNEHTALVGSLQQRLITQDTRVSALETTLEAVNTTLKQLVALANAQAEAPTAAVPSDSVQPVTSPLPAMPEQPAPVQVDPPIDSLADLGALDPTPEQAEEVLVGMSPNEEALKVSAAAVGAGNIDPASFAALNAEIEALLAS